MILTVIQDHINSGNHDIPRLITEIESRVKGTKGESFFNSLRSFFRVSVGSELIVNRIVQKMSELIANVSEKITKKQVDFEELRRPRNRKTIHDGHSCSGCAMNPIIGIRF